MTKWDEWITNVYAYLATAGVCVILLAALAVITPGIWRRLWPLPRVGPGRWTGRDVTLAFLVYLFCPFLVVDFLGGVGFLDRMIDPATADEPKQYHRMIISTPLVLSLTLALLLTLFYARAGTRPGHYGLTRARWPANLALGLLAFLVLALPVLAVHALVGLLVPAEPHPYEKLVKNDFPAWEWPLLWLQVTVAAAVLEEIIFRGVLLGWLRRASLAGHLMIVSVTLLGGVAGSMRLEWDLGPVLFAAALVLGYGVLLFVIESRHRSRVDDVWVWNLTTFPRMGPEPEEGSVEDVKRRQEEERAEWRWQRANGALAVYGSAMLFAVIHLFWPNPVPLFLLGLGLGWLAYRTQSLVGTIVVHCLFNTVGFIVLYWTAVT